MSRYDGNIVIYYLFGLFIRTFEVIVISVIQFFIPRLVTEILKYKRHYIVVRHFFLQLGLF